MFTCSIFEVDLRLQFLDFNVKDDFDIIDVEEEPFEFYSFLQCSLW
jgi:hypothetical protein